MKRLGNVWNKLVSMENLKLAHQRAKEDKSYYKEVKMVDSNPDYYLKCIQDMLVNDTYRITSEDYTYQIIHDKGKDRELMKLSYYPHRIIQWAIMLQIEHKFLSLFIDHTYASIPNRGNSKMHGFITRWMRTDPEGTTFALQLDVRKFYYSIDHDILKELLTKRFKDEKLLNLLYQIVDSHPNKVGIPIGSYLSQYLANFYLLELDHYINEQLGVKYYVRYMDDMLILSYSKEYLHKIKVLIEDYLNSELNLKIKHTWQIYPVDKRGVTFVGYKYFHDFVLLKKKNKKTVIKLCKTIKYKQDHNQLMNYHEWCSINSEIGWMMYSDCYRFEIKYIFPIIKSIIRYYSEVIVKDHPNKDKRVKKYSYKLYKNLGRRY